MTLEDLAIKAKKAVELQKHLENTFGNHPFYKELAFMAVIQDAQYQGRKEGMAETLTKVPIDQAIFSRSRSMGRTDSEAQSFVEGAQYIINKLTDHE